MSRQGWWTPVFGTKTAGKAAVRSIINRYQIGARIEGDDLRVLLEVFSHHPHWTEKQGAGVDGLRVVWVQHAYGSNRGVRLERVDGTETDISWVACFDGRRQDQDVRQAARYEIAGQRDSVPDSGDCPVCGEPLAWPTHVDHAPPMTFERLLGEWMSWRQLGWEDIQVGSNDGIHNQFVDRDLAVDWQTYHETHARLRRVHKRCNLSGARAGGRHGHA